MTRTRKAGRVKSKGKPRRNSRRKRSRRGGMAQLLNQAIVPFGLTYLATRKGRRGSKRRGGSRTKRGGESEDHVGGRRRKRRSSKRRGSKRRSSKRRGSKRRGSKRRGSKRRSSKRRR